MPLFFILSGWLLGAQVIADSLSPQFLRRFWLRRFLRIYPAVWAELLVLLLVAGAIPGLITQAGYDTLPFQLLLWVNLSPVMVQPLNGVRWTLPVELGFSMNFLPGVLSSWTKRRLFWCGAVLLFGLM